MGGPLLDPLKAAFRASPMQIPFSAVVCKANASQSKRANEKKKKKIFNWETKQKKIQMIVRHDECNIFFFLNLISYRKYCQAYRAATINPETIFFFIPPC